MTLIIRFIKIFYLRMIFIYILPLCRAGLLWDRGGGRMQPQAKNGHTGRASVDKLGSPLAGISGGKRSRIIRRRLLGPFES